MSCLYGLRSNGEEPARNLFAYLLVSRPGTLGGEECEVFGYQPD